MNARERQIRKQLRAPQWSWLVVCTPGFEALLVDELGRLGCEASIEANGAVGFSSRLLEAWPILRYCSLANRIYIRLAHFRCGAREELFRKTVDLPWELWLDSTVEIDVRSVVEYSRVSHEGQVAETVKKAILRRLAAPLWPDDSPSSPASTFHEPRRILVRVIHNMVSISLDASGQSHYQRGFRQAGAVAPIRESLAAGLVRWACEGLEPALWHVHDGMCGSASLAIEALALLGGFAPGAGRHFIAETWPGLSAETLNHGRHQDQEIARSHQSALGRVSAWDIDQNACNLSNRAMERALTAWGIPQSWQCQCTDFLTSPAPRIGAELKGCLVLNPPYDIRIDVDVDRLYQNLALTFRKNWCGWRIMLIVPAIQLEKYFPAHARRLGFRHGGLRVAALTWDQI